MASLGQDEDQHPLLDGARWHTPTPGDPGKCVVIGCQRVLTRHLIPDPFAENPEDPEDREDQDVDAGPTAEPPDAYRDNFDEELTDE